MSDLPYSPIEASNIIKKYEAHSNIRGLCEVLITLAIYFTTLIGSYWAYQYNQFIVIIPLSVFNALALVKLYTTQHDCSHGSLFPFRKLNIWFGRLLSIITMTPFYPWRWRHLFHHKIINSIEHRTIQPKTRRDIGYVTFYTVSEYQKKNKINKFMYKLMGNPLVYYLFLAPFYFIVLSRFPASADEHPEESQKKHIYSVILTNIFICIYYGFLISFFGITFFMTIYLMSSILGIAFGTWIFQIQHIFPGTKFFSYKDKDFLAHTFQTTSFYKIPKLLDWFTSSIGYHHVHHLFPTIPGYNLKKCYDENSIFHTVKIITLSDTFKIMKLRLYDDLKLHRLIDWKEYRKLYSK